MTTPHHGSERTGGPTTVLDVAANAKRKMLKGTVIVGPIGLMLITPAFTLDAGAVGVFWGVIGFVLLAFALTPLVLWHKVMRPRKLILEQNGIRWDDPRGTSWAVLYLWEFGGLHNGYRLQLGSAREFVLPIEQAVRAFRPQIYLSTHG